MKRGHGQTTNVWMLGAVGLVALGSLVGCGSSDEADGASAAPTLSDTEAQSLGNELVAEALSASSISADDFESKTTSAFQSLTPGRTATRDEVLEVIGDSNIEYAPITDVRVTQSPGVLVVSYMIQAIVDGTAGEPLRALSTFVWVDGDWKYVSFGETIDQ